MKSLPLLTFFFIFQCYLFHANKIVFTARFSLDDMNKHIHNHRMDFKSPRDLSQSAHKSRKEHLQIVKLPSSILLTKEVKSSMSLWLFLLFFFLFIEFSMVENWKQVFNNTNQFSPVVSPQPIIQHFSHVCFLFGRQACRTSNPVTSTGSSSLSRAISLG